MERRKFITGLAAALTVAALSLILSDAALAQNFQGMNSLNTIASQGQQAGKYVVNIAFVFCGVVGAIMLIPATIKALKGEQSSRDAITNVGLGLITVFVILAIIKVVMSF